MNSMISVLQQGEHSTSVFYLSLPFHLPDKAAVTDARNKMLNTWIRENPTQLQGRKTRRFFPLQYFVMHRQCFTQNPTPAVSWPWEDPNWVKILRIKYFIHFYSQDDEDFNDLTFPSTTTRLRFFFLKCLCNYWMGCHYIGIRLTQILKGSVYNFQSL